MASPSSGPTPGSNPVARDFVRALNVLMRSMRFYGADHQLTKIQVNDAWTRLQSLQSDDGGVRIAVGGTKLLLNGEPTQMGTAESGFVNLLSSLDLASIEFDSSANGDSLRALASILATAKPENMIAMVEENAEKLQGILLNRVRFYEQTMGGPGGAGGPGGGGGDGAPSSSEAKAAASDAAAPAAQPEAPASTSAPENEVAVGWIVNLASQLNAADPGAASKDLDKLEGAQRVLLERLLNESADHSTTQQDRGSLIKIAEHLAVQFASAQMQQGAVNARTVRNLFDRFGHEITHLRTTFGEKVAQPETAAKEQSEELNRKFWANLPEKSKISILLSNDAWIIPPVDVRSFVMELTARGDAAIAAQIVKTYCACVGHEDTEARSKAAAGVAFLAETIHNSGPDVATQLTYTVALRLTTEPDSDVQSQLSNAVVKLVQEACSRRSFRPVEQVLAVIAHLEKNKPELAKELRPRVRIENRLPDFIREAIAQPRFPDGLMPILKRMPQASLAAIVAEYGRRTRRDDCDSLAEMVRAIGPGAIERLTEILRTGSPAEAIAIVGLVSVLATAALAAQLPARVKPLPPQQQAAVVRQVASSPAENRGELLAALLDVVDLSILPMVIDELGFDLRSTAADRLQATASEQQVAPYVRLKAIESLGRLHDQQAVPLLRALILERKMFGWQYHDEMRLTALHALYLIQPNSRYDGELKKAFKPKDLQMMEHRCEPVQRWLRQRRYPRVSPDQPIEAETTTSRGGGMITIEKLSLGGGLAQRHFHGQLGSDGTVEVQAGFKKFRARVLIQELGARRLIFEITDISLDDRWRLRQLLNEHLLHAAPQSATVVTNVAAPAAAEIPTGTDAFNDDRYHV